MKLRKLHLFLIIIFVIVASTLGFTVHEYFDNRRPSEIALDNIKSKHTPPPENAALSKGKKYNPFLNPKISPKCVSVVRNSLFVDPDYVGEKNWYSVSVRALNLPMPAKYTHVWKPIFSFMFCFEHIGACF